MRFACAEEDGGLMRYVKRARACDDSDRLIRFRRERVMTCAHQGGYVYLVRKRAACKRERHWPSLALRVPGAGPRSFCAHRRTGLLRSTRHLPYDPPRPPKPGQTACKSSEKRLVVRPWNKRPNAVRDAATVAADGPAAIDVLANDSDPEGAELAVARVIPGAIRGSVAVAADGGSVTYDPSGRFDSLGAGATATERFRYAASDGRRRDRARVTVTVTGVNEAPRAGADGAGTNEDTATNISVLGNDSDGDAGDVLRVTAVDRTGTAGTVAINPNGTLRYDPAGQLREPRRGRVAQRRLRLHRLGRARRDGERQRDGDGFGHQRRARARCHRLRPRLHRGRRSRRGRPGHRGRRTWTRRCSPARPSGSPRTTTRPRMSWRSWTGRGSPTPTATRQAR